MARFLPSLLQRPRPLSCSIPLRLPFAVPSPFPLEHRAFWLSGLAARTGLGGGELTTDEGPSLPAWPTSLRPSIPLLPPPPPRDKQAPILSSRLEL
jgi:hypothetical protein